MRARLLVANVDPHALVRHTQLFHHPDGAHCAGSARTNRASCAYSLLRWGTEA
jgi:hypothetical protein